MRRFDGGGIRDRVAVADEAVDQFDWRLRFVQAEVETCRGLALEAAQLLLKIFDAVADRHADHPPVVQAEERLAHHQAAMRAGRADGAEDVDLRLLAELLDEFRDTADVPPAAV